jgi:multiple sugar transport system substrate-binding protein
MINRKLRAAAILVAFPMILMACGTDNGGDKAASTPSGGGTKDFRGVVLRETTAAGGLQTSLTFANEWLLQKTGIKVETNGVPVGDVRSVGVLDAKSAHRLDIVTNNDQWTGELNPGSIPLNDYIKRDNFDMSSFIEGLPELFTENGQVYALPTRIGGRVLVYRKDLLEKAGATAPPKTWEELRDLARKMTTKDTSGFTISLGQNDHMLDSWLEVYLGFGGKFMENDEFAFNGKAGAESLQFLIDMRKEGSIGKDAVGLDDSGLIAAMQTGRAAMTIAFSGWVGPMTDPKVSKFPTVIAATRAPYSQSSGLTQAPTLLAGWGRGISKFTKNKDAAWEAVKASVNPEVQIKGSGYAATVNSVFADPGFNTAFPQAKSIYEASVGGVAHPQIPQWGQVAALMKPILSKAIEGNITAQAAMDQITQEANKLIGK